MNEKDPHRYDDILEIPYVKSHNRKQMSNYDRAAQFAPFAALTGYSESIAETGRYTDAFIEIGEQEKEELDRKVRILMEHIPERPEIDIEYFVPDLYKEGGSYQRERVSVYRIDMQERVLITMDKRKIDLYYITDMDSDIFKGYEEI